MLGVKQKMLLPICLLLLLRKAAERAGGGGGGEWQQRCAPRKSLSSSVGRKRLAMSKALPCCPSVLFLEKRGHPRKPWLGAMEPMGASELERKFDGTCRMARRPSSAGLKGSGPRDP